MASEDDRSYQRTLIDQANAEMGRQRMSRRELARATGIHRNTLDRLFLCERDLNVTQWDAIAHALGFDPGELARMAGDAAALRRDREPPTDPGIHPEDERLIDESDKLTRSQRSELKATLRGGPASERPMSDRLHPAKSVSSSARRRGRAGA